jgi:putative oxidoreductase
LGRVRSRTSNRGFRAQNDLRRDGTLTAQTPRQRSRSRVTAIWSVLFRTEPTGLALDVALVPVRIVLAWIFIYYGAGKLFGAFNGPGIHRTALYFADTAHLRPGGLFAVLGGVIEFGGAIAIALGLGSRLAGLALFGDQVVAMITVTWANGINPLTSNGGYEFNLALVVLALVVVALGAGRLSIDNLIGRRLRATRAAVDGGPSSSPSSPEHIPQHAEIPPTRRLKKTLQ